MQSEAKPTLDLVESGDGMRERFLRFMQGRYGVDTLNKFLTGMVFVLLVAAIFIHKPAVAAVVNVVTLVLIVVLYMRMLSKNYAKRYAENEWFLKVTEPVRSFFRRKRSHAAQRKDYRLFKCPGCRQMVRVPKGKGRISIRCPKCQKEFIRKS